MPRLDESDNRSGRIDDPRPLGTNQTLATCYMPPALPMPIIAVDDGNTEAADPLDSDRETVVVITKRSAQRLRYSAGPKLRQAAVASY